MWALGIDTAGVTQSVVLLHTDGRQYMRQSQEQRQQGEIVHGFVSACVAEAGITLQNIGVIAVVTGPGSFTGLRIGLALGQGFARALGCHVAGYDRFSLLAAELPDAVIVLESLRAELFVQAPGEAIAMLEPPAILAQLNGRMVAGDGAGKLGLVAVEASPEAELAARKALKVLAAGTELPAALPLYVRPPDVTQPKPLV